MYWRLSSCSARSARLWSNGRPSVRPTSRSALRNASLSNSLMPAKSISAMVGRSSTITTTTSFWISTRTSLNRPSAKSARIAAEPFSSLYWSPMRKGSDAKMVPGSTRCRPSTRMSLTENGETAHAFAAKASAATAETVRTRKRLMCFFMNQGWARTASWAMPFSALLGLSKQARDVVEQLDRHHEQQHRDPATLQALHPGLGDAPARDGLPKIIHQVPPIQDRERQQVQHTEAHGNEGEEHEVLREPEARRLARVVGDGEGARQILYRRFTDDHAPEHAQREKRNLPGADCALFEALDRAVPHSREFRRGAHVGADTPDRPVALLHGVRKDRDID